MANRYEKSNNNYQEKIDVVEVRANILQLHLDAEKVPRVVFDVELGDLRLEGKKLEEAEKRTTSLELALESSKNKVDAAVRKAKSDAGANLL